MVGEAKRVAAVVLAVVGIAAMMTLSPAEATTIKPGRPCATVGEKVVQGPWTFTCTLKKGKRVWVRQRTPAPVLSWVTVAKGLQASAAKRPKPSLTSTFSVTASPTVPQATVDAVATAVRSAFVPWQSVAPVADGFPVFILDEQSKDWYLEQSSRFPNDGCGLNWWSRYSFTATSLGGAVCSSPNHAWGYMAVMVGSQATPRHRLMDAHEATHIAQMALLGPPQMTQMECWLGEGMAQVYTVAGGFGTLADFNRLTEASAFRSDQIRQLRGVLTDGTTGSTEFWLDVIRRSENRGSELCVQQRLGYTLGLLVSERLIEEFGEDRLLQWLRATRVSGDSDASFTEVFGITQDTWYAQSAAPYVAREAALLLG